MARHLIDTNHLSPVVTPTHQLRARILNALEQGHEFFITIEVLTEFLFGIFMTPREIKNRWEWETLRRSFIIYSPDIIDAYEAATIQATLKRRGRQLGMVDALVAATALRYDYTVLTIDQDFNAISLLKIENWLLP